MTHHEQSKRVTEVDGVRFLRGHEGEACTTDGHLSTFTDKIFGVHLEGDVEDVGDHARGTVERGVWRRASQRGEPLCQSRRCLGLASHSDRKSPQGSQQEP
ncbi:BZ3500_MvSof-1268-A1-R1_Chr1-3g01926 [Microbotryum saponariae]|uniref:BZ3500_MvSof-1268-A1-R1_Chr1-3g01926 protein n=1 Tax=Microbotryum saponariae TaxID=289078 RepID=A0A2X0KFF7_9BASI|nr:BZ3500_MvSof-1268-A1-R1_Chr1-3g01926 [Microbotryum saponariae]SCZ94922.1 BZ3501_MvSof-1269-A2-R1_Chr1-3g01528 [Microbotryum saponariae]